MTRRLPWLLLCCVACGAPPPLNPDSGPAGDGGPPDAGAVPDSGGVPPDSGTAPDAGPSDAGGCPYRFCEDFESYDGGPVTNAELLGPWKATVSGLGVDARLDGVNPHSGLLSFHITVPADAGTRATLGFRDDAGIIPGNDVFGRMEVYYSATSPYGLPLGVHSWLFNAAGGLDGGMATMNMGGGGAALQLNYHPPQGVEQSVRDGGISAGTWHCIQWEYNGSGTLPADTANVWIDGTLAVNVPASKGWAFPPLWQSFDFGFTHYQALTNPVDVYVDDFALDSAMVPCP